MVGKLHCCHHIGNSSILVKRCFPFWTYSILSGEFTLLLLYWEFQYTGKELISLLDLDYFEHKLTCIHGEEITLLPSYWQFQYTGKEVISLLDLDHVEYNLKFLYGGEIRLLPTYWQFQYTGEEVISLLSWDHYPPSIGFITWVVSFQSHIHCIEPNFVPVSIQLTSFKMITHTA